MNFFGLHSFLCWLSFSGYGKHFLSYQCVHYMLNYFLESEYAIYKTLRTWRVKFCWQWQGERRIFVLEVESKWVKSHIPDLLSQARPFPVSSHFYRCIHGYATTYFPNSSKECIVSCFLTFPLHGFAWIVSVTVSPNSSSCWLDFLPTQPLKSTVSTTFSREIPFALLTECGLLLWHLPLSFVLYLLMDMP
jgi:hypothetical protein